MRIPRPFGSDPPLHLSRPRHQLHATRPGATCLHARRLGHCHRHRLHHRCRCQAWTAARIEGRRHGNHHRHTADGIDHDLRWDADLDAADEPEKEAGARDGEDDMFYVYLYDDEGGEGGTSAPVGPGNHHDRMYAVLPDVRAQESPAPPPASLQVQPVPSNELGSPLGPAAPAPRTPAPARSDHPAFFVSVLGVVVLLSIFLAYLIVQALPREKWLGPGGLEGGCSDYGSSCGEEAEKEDERNGGKPTVVGERGQQYRSTDRERQSWSTVDLEEAGKDIKGEDGEDQDCSGNMSASATGLAEREAKHLKRRPEAMAVLEEGGVSCR
jgi:hypothetical protein